MASLAEGIQGLVKNMRGEQQMLRDWIEAQQEEAKAMRKTLDKLTTRIGHSEQHCSEPREVRIAGQAQPRGRHRRGMIHGACPQRPPHSARSITGRVSSTRCRPCSCRSCSCSRVFVLAQFLLSREISGKDEVLTRLNSQINELTQLLALEKGGKQDLEDSLANLQASLSQSEGERSRLKALLDQGAGSTDAANEKLGRVGAELDAERQTSARAMSQIELLNQQIAALRSQIAAIEEALQASEAKDQSSQTKIADLGRRLNVALAQRVQELNRYRSDFFGRLREILSDRENIRIVGDRFVFQSEVLFPSGGNELNPEGQD